MEPVYRLFFGVFALRSFPPLVETKSPKKKIIWGTCSTIAKKKLAGGSLLMKFIELRCTDDSVIFSNIALSLDALMPPLDERNLKCTRFEMYCNKGAATKPVTAPGGHTIILKDWFETHIWLDCMFSTVGSRICKTSARKIKIKIIEKWKQWGNLLKKNVPHLVLVWQQSTI